MLQFSFSRTLYVGSWRLGITLFLLDMFVLSRNYLHNNSKDVFAEFWNALSNLASSLFVFLPSVYFTFVLPLCVVIGSFVLDLFL